MKFGYLILAAAFPVLSTANNDDLFNYGMGSSEENGDNSYGQNRWNRVSCDDLGECVSSGKIALVVQPPQYSIAAHSHSISDTFLKLLLHISVLHRLDFLIIIRMGLALRSTKMVTSVNGVPREKVTTIAVSIDNLPLIFNATEESLAVKTKKNALTGTGCKPETIPVHGMI